VFNKDLAVLVIGRVVQVFILLLAIRLITATLDPEQLGNYYLIMSICSFFGLFLINPVGQYINRHTHAWHDADLLLEKMFNFNFYVIGASVISVFVVTLLYMFGVAKDINYHYLIIFIPLFVFFNTWNQTIVPMINMLEYRIAFTAFTALTLLASLILSYILAQLFATEAIYWFMGQIAGMAIFAVAALYYFYHKITKNFSYRRARTSISVASLKPILKFSVPLSFGVFFLWMQTQSYRMVIGSYIGSEFLGFFGAGLAIATGISSSFEMITMQFIYPKMYKSMKDPDSFQEVFAGIVNMILPIYLILSIFVSIFAVYITNVLVDERYSSSYVYLIAGIWFEFFRMGTNLVANVAHSRLNTSKLLVPYALGGLFILFGTYFAAHGERYATLIPAVLVSGGLLSFLAMYQKMNSMVRMRLRGENFVYVLVVSLPFISGYFLYDYAPDIIFSLLILAVFGLYFLFVLYLLIKRQGESV